MSERNTVTGHDRDCLCQRCSDSGEPMRPITRPAAPAAAEPRGEMMQGIEALGNGNDHFGVHEMNAFCERRGCLALAEPVPQSEPRSEIAIRLNEAQWWYGKNDMWCHDGSIQTMRLERYEAALAAPSPAETSQASAGEARLDERKACWEDFIQVIRNSIKDCPESFELRALHEAVFAMGWRDLGTGDGKPMHQRPGSAVNERALATPAPQEPRK